MRNKVQAAPKLMETRLTMIHSIFPSFFVIFVVLLFPPVFLLFTLYAVGYSFTSLSGIPHFSFILPFSFRVLNSFHWNFHSETMWRQTHQTIFLKLLSHCSITANASKNVSISIIFSLRCVFVLSKTIGMNEKWIMQRQCHHREWTRSTMHRSKLKHFW